ncbi:MAG: DinB family protein [Planctomycetota bacterium]
MPRSFGNNIADSVQRCVDYADTLLKGVPADRFARFAAPGGEVIESNHPAFILGHLALYGERIVDHCGGDAASVAAPEGFAAVFSKDAKCQDDPEGTIYPPMEEVIAAFKKGYEAGIAALRSAPDGMLDEENPVAAMIPRFPTKGSVLAFYGGGHMMVHLGQFSAWRRMAGLGAA